MLSLFQRGRGKYTGSISGHGRGSRNKHYSNSSYDDDDNNNDNQSETSSVRSRVMIDGGSSASVTRRLSRMLGLVRGNAII